MIVQLLEKKDKKMPDAPAPPPIPPLFPSWTTPKGTMPAIYAWKAYVNGNTIISSVVGHERPLSDIPNGVWAIVYYSSKPGDPILRTIDCGDTRPYTFYLPDGTIRTTSNVITAANYNKFIAQFEAQDTYPT